MILVRVDDLDLVDDHYRGSWDSAYFMRSPMLSFTYPISQTAGSFRVRQSGSHRTYSNQPTMVDALIIVLHPRDQYDSV